LGVIGAAGHLGKGRAVQVIGEVGQDKLCKITVLMQKSCQPRKKIKKYQKLTGFTSLSSVDWRPVLARTPRYNSKHYSHLVFILIKMISLILGLSRTIGRGR
jgi:hypothetical protein